jgi:hypothetical protein
MMLIGQKRSRWSYPGHGAFFQRGLVMPMILGVTNGIQRNIGYTWQWIGFNI